MSFWNWLTRRRPDHGWPGYIINGRIRTSTAGLIIAFIAVAWLHNAYQPPPPAATAPETQVVPPGFVPDPEYTWVPRTYVERPKTTTETTETTTTESSPTETSPTGTSTVINDPDGTGPLPATTVTETPATSPVPGTSAVPTTTVTTTVLSPSLPSMPLAPPR